MEEQQGEAAEKTAGVLQTEKVAEQDRQRRLQGLQMQRERILSERTSSSHRRSALSLALADIERELEQLGWTFHI